jgi:hypothetical protein
MRRARVLASIAVAAVTFAQSIPVLAQEYGTAPPPQPTPVAAAAQPGAAGAVSLAYLQYMQYLTMLNYGFAVSAAGSSYVPPDYAQWLTNGAQATSVPTTGPGAAYFTNGAEATSLPTTAPTAPAPSASTPPAPPASAAPPPPPPPAPSASAPPPAPSAAPSAAALPLAQWIQGTPIAESAQPQVAAPSVPTAAPVAIEKPESMPVTLTSAEQPRAVVSLAGAAAPSAEHAGGTLALILAALVTGALVGILAVVRFRAGGAPPRI